MNTLSDRKARATFDSPLSLVGWRIFCPILLCAGALSLFAAAGDVDLGFDAGSAVNGTINSLAVQPDGKIIIAGGFTTVRRLFRNRVARLNNDGTGDSGFEPGAGANREIRAVALQADGKVLLAGAFDTFNDTAHRQIVRLNSNGSIDLDFKPVQGVSTLINCIAIQAEGRILVPGDFLLPNGGTSAGIGRLNSDGTIDPTFQASVGPKCGVCSAAISAILIQTDGKIVIGGGFTTVGGASRNGIARLNADGTLDPSFAPGDGVGPSGFFSSAEVFAMTLQQDGQILIGGSFTTYGTSSRSRIARLNVDGTLDTTFNPGTGADGDVRALTVGSDGKIFVAGAFQTFNRVNQARLALLSATGTVENFKVALDQPVRALGNQNDGKVLIAGDFTTVGSTNHQRIARLNGDGSVDPAFVPDPGANDDIRAIALAQEGKIVAAGGFTWIGGVSRNRVARLNPDGTLDLSFNPGTGADNPVNAAAVQPDDKVLIGGLFGVVDGKPRNRLARLNGDGSLDPAFLPGAGVGVVNAILLQPDGKVLLGGFGVGRLNPDGSADPAFKSAAGSGGVLALALQPDGKIVLGGGFGRLARLNADGSIDNSFGPVSVLDLEVFAVTLQPDGKILAGGAFQSALGHHVARYTANGIKDSSFSSTSFPNGPVYTLALQTDGRILIGGVFDNIGGTTRTNIARLNADGTLDGAFNASANDDVRAFNLQSDGKLLAGGTFTTINNAARWKIARLLSETIKRIEYFPLTLGVAATNRFATAGDRAFFTVEVPPGGSLKIALTDLDQRGINEIYARRGAPPTAGAYDYRSATRASADQMITIPDADAGLWYIMTYGTSVPVPGDYTIRADWSNDLSIRSITPNQAADLRLTPIAVEGNGFGPTPAVQLRSGSQVIATGDVNVAAKGRLLVQFNAPVAPGTYQLTVLAGTNGASVPFTTTAGGASHLDLKLLAQSTWGRRIPGTLYVEYANTGTGSMRAPILVVHGSEHALLTLDSSLVPFGLWSETKAKGVSDTVQILGSGNIPGLLQPGERMRVPVYYCGLQRPIDFSHETIRFELGLLDSSNATPIDWNSLKPLLLPPNSSPEGWDQVANNLAATVGSTWGNFASMAAENALHLGNLGLNITNIADLFSYQIAQAEGLNPLASLPPASDVLVREPGLDLTFARIYPQLLSERFHVGSLGRGWRHNWDFKLSVDPAGVVTLSSPAGAPRIFQPDSRSGYFNAPGEYGTLNSLGNGRYQILDQTGLKSIFRSDGLLDFLEDLNGNRISASYTTDGLLTALTHSSGHKLLFKYTGSLLQSVTDPLNRIVTYKYDAAQHLINVSDSGGTALDYSYSNLVAARAHSLTRITHPSGVSTFFTYDSRGRLENINRDDGSSTTKFSYGKFGTVNFTDGENRPGAIHFDHRGLVYRIDDAQQGQSRLYFDRNANLAMAQGPDGRSTSFTVDNHGNTTRFLNQAGFSTTLSYTANSRPSWITDARQQTTAFSYDSRGNLTGMILPDQSLRGYQYSASGDLTVYTNARGQKIELIYDAFGRVTRKTYPDGRAIGYSYDTHGNLSMLTDSIQGSTTLEYDIRDQLTRLAYPNGRALTFAYDAAGRRSARTTDDGYMLKYFYGSSGQLERLEDGSARLIIKYTYDKSARLIREDKGNGAWTTYEYSSGGLLAGVRNFGLDGTLTSSFEYNFDSAGNCTKLKTLAGTTTFTYDAMGQLVEVNKPDGNRLSYAYDPLGNRTRINENKSEITYKSNNHNQYIEAGDAKLTYDKDGNLVQRINSSGTTTFVYDAENRLVRMNSPLTGAWEYEYNALGQRSALSHNGDQKSYLFDGGGFGDIIAEYSAAGALVQRYDYGVGLVATTDGAAKAFYNFDGAGNTREIIGSEGVVLNRYEYAPFAAVTVITEQIGNPFTFVGRGGVLNDRSGSLHMKVRSYSPELGRFLQFDPKGMFFSLDPLSYTYAANNPITEVDPLGLRSFPWSNADPAWDQWSENQKKSELALNYGYLATLYYGAPQDVKWLVMGIWQAVANRDTLFYGGYNPRTAYEIVKSVTIGIPTLLFPEGRAVEAAGVGFLSNLSRIPSGLFELLTDGIALEIYWGWSAVDWLVNLDFFQINQYIRLLVNSFDPNELVGPAGYGPLNYIAPAETFPYRINFENAANATAPAQVVVISNPLSKNLDLSTLEFTTIGFGDHVLPIPAGSQHYQHSETISYKGTDFEVAMEARVDYEKREIQVRFESLMPGTGLPPTVDIGFLPPEDGTRRGDGFVEYTIKPVTGLPTGTEIRDIATISFDPLSGGAVFRTDLTNPRDPTSAPTPERQALVTIDADPPSSQVLALPSTFAESDFQVAWSGSDAGSGIASYNVFVQTDHQGWSLWQANTIGTNALWHGSPGRTYGFFVAATDATGLKEARPNEATQPQATTTVGAQNVLRVFDLTPEKIELQLAGAAGEKWTIQRTTALGTPWEKFQDVTLDPSGTAVIRDLLPLPAAFYRAFR
jgi:RHS repeat-associated protein/uncharacterized delta-60 repeat protein